VTPGSRLALVIFAVIVVVGPLAFGAVDRLTQIALAALLAVGVWALPPEVRPLGLWGTRLAIALVGILVLKEFLPAIFFGGTAWRREATRDLGLALPWTHHPEPARVLDAALTALVAGVWFLWVRTLAGGHERREAVAWCLFLGAAIVAAVSFATRGIDPDAIYGLRYTPGWVGFGPFPNRNHSATLFAMGAVLGLGCAAWAWVRRKWPLFATALVLAGVLVAALLDTESRGGLVAFTAGVGVFIGLTFLKLRSRTVIYSGLAIVLVVGTLTVAFGSEVLTRFRSPNAGHVSTQLRLAVWSDTLGMVRDAPLLGHGVAAFRSIFPLYQRLEAEEIVVLHPESSWLQWLAELGAIPVALGALGVALFLAPQVRAAFARHHSFYLHAAAFAAAAILLLHAVYDVPAHRWGTAGFALAALALACPVEGGGSHERSRRLGWVLAAIAGFWALPFVIDGPAWSPLHLSRLLARDAARSDVRLAEFERSLRWFPLTTWLHQGLATRQLQVDGRARPGVWQRHFAIASRLVPASWTVPAAQARAAAGFAPELALGYWQQAVDRGRLHRSEILGTALVETAEWPSAAAAWSRYAEANPELLLTYAALQPEEQGRYFFAQWWEQRGRDPGVTEAEVEAFYTLLPRLGERVHLDDWMGHNAAREERDYRRWAELMHRFGDQETPWNLLTARMPEPPFPATAVTLPRAELEAKWRITPGDFMNAQQLVQLLHRQGEIEQSDEIVLAVVARSNPAPPPWFTRKAAYIRSRQGKIKEAVATLLASK
jgi:O-antigen ligase